MQAAVHSEALPTTQQVCWRMLGEAARVLDLAAFDDVVVAGPGMLDHVVVLARQYPGARFSRLDEEVAGGLLQSSRLLWVTAIDAMPVVTACPSGSAHGFDAIVVCHGNGDVAEALASAPGFARIAARRADDDAAVSVFGRGLKRALFRDPSRTLPRPRLAVAAQTAAEL